MTLLLALGCSPANKVDASGEGDPHDSAELLDSANTDDTAGNENSPPCPGPSQVVPLATGASETSPYAAQLVDDLDGGGLPDVLYERVEGTRGVAMVTGEDLAFGDTTVTSWFAGQVSSEQAGFAVGLVDDVDGDGLDDVVLAETPERGRRLLTVTSPLRPEVTLLELELPEAENAGVLIPEASPPDLDGDGIGELLVLDTTPPAVLVYRGGVAPDAAWMTIEAELTWADSPVVTPDLDGDGVEDIVLPHVRSDATEEVRLLTGADVTPGVIAAVDLPVLFGMGHKRPLFADIDDDGYPEAYVAADMGTVYGFTGARMVDAGFMSLGVGDAHVRLDGGERDYLGAQIDVVTDDSCLPGLAVSAHFAGRVYLLDNTKLVGGGVVDATTFGLAGPDWYGYTQDGGQDLDGDGSLDLITGGNTGGDFRLFLAPFGSGS